MTRAVTVAEVASPTIWAELEACLPPERWVGRVRGTTTRELRPEGEGPLLERMQAQGVRALIRDAHRAPAEIEAAREDLAGRVAGLPASARRVLHAAQRHALDDVVMGLHAWDPVGDAPSVRALHGAGLITAIDNANPAYLGRYRLAADLPPPPPVDYDFEEAVMPETDDLGVAGPGPVGLLHDMAALAAALRRVRPKRTLSGTVARADARRLGRQLGSDELARSGALEEHPRHGRALRALDALGAASTDPLSREVVLDLGLEAVLAGTTREAIDRLVHRLVDRDLHCVVPAVRAALQSAGDEAIDEVIFLDLLREQHRDVLFPAWEGPGCETYPTPPGEPLRPYDEANWDRVEAPLVRSVLKRMEHLGLIRRAAGVFAGSADGRRWAGATDPTPAPMWARSDLELMVPPDALTPWERFQIERLSRALARDVVDRYRLEREGLESWLETHDLDEAVALLRRRCPGVPAVVEDTLRAWAGSAMRVVFTRGVLVEDPAANSPLPRQAAAE